VEGGHGSRDPQWSEDFHTKEKEEGFFSRKILINPSTTFLCDVQKKNTHKSINNILL
jgi:hypothetical protein